MKTTINGQIWTIGAAIIAVAIVAMGWFLGISPALDQASLADTQRVSVLAQNLGHEQEVVSLKKQYDNLPELQSKLNVLTAAVPSTGDLSTFLGQLHSLESSAGVVLNNFTASDGQLYTPAPSASKLVTTTDPLITPANFVPITIGVSVTGSQDQVMAFVKSLQDGSRLFLVTGLNLVQDPLSGESKGTITGLVYVLLDKPATPAAAAASVQTGTTSTTTP